MNHTGLFVIGDENAVFGFGLLGVAGQVVGSAMEARTTLEHVLDNQTVEIVLITDFWAQVLRADLDQLLVTRSTPLIVEIPGAIATSAQPVLRERLRQVLGVNLGDA
jgi:vacuolar-type H+-ATPase subunit F/Vma7